MISRCVSLVVILIMAAGNPAFVQNMTYSRIALPQEEFQAVQDIVQADHMYMLDGQVILEESERILEELQSRGVFFDVLIPDLTAFYREQNVSGGVRSGENGCESGHHPVPENFKLGSMGGYLTLKELQLELTEMHNQYPQLITNPEPIPGFKTHENRAILQVRISGKRGKDSGKKGVLYTALHHAREPLSMQQLIYFMWYLLENYDKDPLVTEIMDQTNLYFIPCVNPDGYAYNNETAPDGGGMWRGNRQLTINEFGVDLNRNYGYKWGYDDSGSSGDFDSEIYRGTEAFSEPETQAVKWFCEENTISTALNYHAFGDYLIYPWGYTDAGTNDDREFRALAQSLSMEKRILTGNSVETVMYTTNGDTDDWMYGEVETKNRIFSFTPEVGPAVYGFYPPRNQIERLCAREVNQNLRMAMAAHQFVHLVHSGEPMTDSRSFQHRFYLYPLSVEESAVTVTTAPVSDNIQSTGASMFFVDAKDREELSVKVELKPGTQPGEKVVFALTADNGSFSRTDTISYIYNPDDRKTEVLNESNIDDLWVSSSSSGSGWGVSRTTYYTPPGSVTDSPQGRYVPGTENILESRTSFLIPDEEAVFLTFRARWEITHAMDFARLSVSTDGQNYVPLCGKWTTDRFKFQGERTPVYTGYQEEWLVETISLREYAGQEVYFRWEMISESSDGHDGIFIDDMKIVYSSVLTASDHEPVADTGPVIYPNPVSGNRLFVRFPDEGSGAATRRYEIKNMMGAVMYSGTVTGTVTEIPIPDLAAGVYVFQLKEDSGLTFSPRKFIVAR